MDNFLFTLRIPFFLFGAVLCLAFDVIRFPVIIVFHITWTVWVVVTRMLGFPFRLLFAAWKNDPTLLTSGLEESSGAWRAVGRLCSRITSAISGTWWNGNGTVAHGDPANTRTICDRSRFRANAAYAISAASSACRGASSST